MGKSKIFIVFLTAVFILLIATGCHRADDEKMPRETIVVGDSGISLLLPDGWNGKYGYDLINSGAGGPGVIVYHLATRETSTEGGILFAVWCEEGQYPMDYIFPTPGFAIAITDTNTYIMGFPSDVQADISNPESWAEYDELSADVKNIEIVLTEDMRASTINASNWVPGTVFVTFLDDWQITKTVICDEEKSKMIKEIMESQEYSAVSGFGETGYPSDLRIMFGGEEHLMDATTGFTYSPLTGKGATLSAEDLVKLIDLLGS